MVGAKNKWSLNGDRYICNTNCHKYFWKFILCTWCSEPLILKKVCNVFLSTSKHNRQPSHTNLAQIQWITSWQNVFKSICHVRYCTRIYYRVNHVTFVLFVSDFLYHTLILLCFKTFFSSYSWKTNTKNYGEKLGRNA